MIATFGERIADLRTNEGITQKALAKEVGTKRSSIAQWENDNTTTIPSKYIKKLAEYFSVSSDYLLGLSDEPSPKANLQAINKKTGLTVEALKAFVHFKENDHVLGNKTKSTDKCTSLSRVLSSRAFLENVTSLMMIDKGNLHSSVPDVAVLNNLDYSFPFYECRLTPESMFDLQALRLITILKEIRDGTVDNAAYETDDFPF